MPEGEWHLFVAELERLMRDAQSGVLDFVEQRRGQREGDVDQMMAAPTVLELRFKTTTGTQDGARKVRLYFSEPIELPDTLLALKLATKYPGEVGLSEQTQHAHQAAARGDRYVAAKGTGMA